MTSPIPPDNEPRPSSECEGLQGDIVALLYDDGEPAERGRAREHLARCVPCRIEYSELKGVRGDLRGWGLPPSTIAPVVPRKSFGVRYLPAGLAAAAGLVLGIGVSMASRDAFSPSSPTTLEGDSSSAAARLQSPPAAAARFVSYDELEQLLQKQESRHQAELNDLRQSLIEVSESVAPAQNALKAVSNVSPAVIERLLKQSEERQARMVEARLSSLKTQADLQRQYDMAQIAAGLAYIDSRTGADAARTSELMKNLVRVTAKPQDR